MGRVNQQWLPLMGTPDAYTERGRRFDSVLKYLMGGDLPLRLQGMSRYYNRYVAPEAGPDTRELSRAASTVHVRYRVDPGLGVDENELNAKVRRIVPPADARSRSVNPAFAELTGRITVPVLAIHAPTLLVAQRVWADTGRRHGPSARTACGAMAGPLRVRWRGARTGLR